jgi:hypothetical protein
MQRSSTGVCAMDILLKQKSRRMDRGASRNLKIAWEVAEQPCSATLSMGAMEDVLAISRGPLDGLGRGGLRVKDNGPMAG